MFSLRRKKNTDDDRPSMCRYCENASPLHDDSEVLCRLRGVVLGDHVCRKFMYDPLKRKPMTRRPLPTLDIDTENEDTENNDTTEKDTRK